MANNNLQAGYVDADGARLYYEMAGAGPDLIMLHSGVTDRRMWDDQFDVFAGRFRVVRYDRRGFGGTKMTPPPHAPVRDLHRLVQALSLQNAHFMGSSQGGGIVLDYILEYPGSAASLILVAPAVGGFPMPGTMPLKLAELMAARRAGELERAAALQAEIWAQGPNRALDRTDERTRERVAAMGLEALKLQAPSLKETGFVPETPPAAPAFERLAEIAAPAFIVYGDEDDELSGEIADELCSRMKRARYALIPGAAHFPNMEKPSMFNRVVMDFIDRLEGPVTPPPETFSRF
jgi:3-oxoadipate enol-lactonase